MRRPLLRRLRAIATRRHPTQVVVLGFVAAIAVGTLLLWLPPASAEEGSAPLGAALFTATSAVTVTGLVVVDTPTYWTPFGQVVILALIQIGGFGLMTGASLLFLVAARRLGLRGRLAAQAETQTLDLGDLRRLVLGVAVLTLAFEAAATIAIGTRLAVAGEAYGDAAWHGLFHAVSSFNNAGFALYSDSFIGFVTDAWLMVPVALTVIAGGLGFPVWLDLARRDRRPQRWSLHTKLTLAATGAFLAAGVALVTALEWSNEGTLGAHGAGGKLTAGFFAGVMPRTAGFNALDYGEMNPETLLVSDVLMFVGGGSGSTAGGIKVTTAALLLMIVWAEVRGRSDVSAFRRRMPPSAQRQALAIVVVSLAVVLAATLFLMIDSQHGLSPALFEVVSAFGTVGLSTGITPGLSDAARVVLEVLMLAGRVGPMTLAVALILREAEPRYRHPEERPLVG